MILLFFLNLKVSVAPSEFVPLQLTVEPDVSDDPKSEDQISGRLRRVVV